MQPNYRRTLAACYLGFITQAIAANFAPLLFLTFHRDYGIPLGQIALISGVFFFTQLLVDFLCARFVDRIGYRASVIAAEAASGLGLAGLAFLPDLLPDPFAGILCCVVVYAIGSGLTEVLVSPIVEACPFEHKESVMSLLHSFCCWGSVGTVALTTLFFAVFGVGAWRVMACLWALVPLANIANFAVCPIEHLVEEGEGMTIRQLAGTPLFWLLALLMVCAGASELAMAQWASAFTESALQVTKTAGDLAGPCLFAVLMGLSRVFYGKFGEKINLTTFMMGSALLCVACYLLAALAAAPLLGLIGCAVCGFSVGIMWPGTISVSAHALPRGGTALFALLALFGDLGGSLGPALVGGVSQLTGDNLHLGLLSGVIFPAVLLLACALLKKRLRPSP